MYSQDIGMKFDIAKWDLPNNEKRIIISVFIYFFKEWMFSKKLPSCKRMSRKTNNLKQLL